MAEVLSLLALSLDLVCVEKNQDLQDLEVTCWSSWFEKVKNDGNKISSAFLPLDQQKGGRGRRAGCRQSCCAWQLWVVPALGDGVSASEKGGLAASRTLGVL